MLYSVIPRKSTRWRCGFTSVGPVCFIPEKNLYVYIWHCSSCSCCSIPIYIINMQPYLPGYSSWPQELHFLRQFDLLTSKKEPYTVLVTTQFKQRMHAKLCTYTLGLRVDHTDLEAPLASFVTVERQKEKSWGDVSRENVSLDDVIRKSKSSACRLREFTFWSQLGEELHKTELKEKIKSFHIQYFFYKSIQSKPI